MKTIFDHYKGEFLINENQLGFSGPRTDHLLWRSQNLWVMDNHRLALWCWMQHLKKDRSYNLLHIDAHYDCAPSSSEKTFDDIQKLSLSEYRKATQTDGTSLFLWDNYLSIMQKAQSIPPSNTIFFTHHIGIPGKHDRHYAPWELIPMLEQFFDHADPWIVNLDIDYFYSRKWKSAPLFHQETIAEAGRLINQANKDGKIECLTVAMSPECVGGWEQAFKTLSVLLPALLE